MDGISFSWEGDVGNVIVDGIFRVQQRAMPVMYCTEIIHVYLDIILVGGRGSFETICVCPVLHPIFLSVFSVRAAPGKVASVPIPQSMREPSSLV